MYLTPDRFRTMGLGVSLSDVEDVELRSALHRARAVVDSYCNVPLLPQPHDFRGGTTTDEEHEWRHDNYEVTPKPFRIYPWHLPILEITDFKIYSSPTVYTDIEPNEVFINNSGGWVEISSLKLTQFGIFGAVGLMIGMFHPVVRLSYTYGRQTAVVGEYLEPTDAGVYRAMNQWWLASPAPEIKKNGVVVTTGFTTDLDEGTVTFSPALTATDVVTVSYSHRLPAPIAEATAIITADELGERRMRARGMIGVAQLTAGEITIRRTTPQGTPGGGTLTAETIPQEAQAKLAPFVFTTVR